MHLCLQSISAYSYTLVAPLHTLASLLHTLPLYPRIATACAIESSTAHKECVPCAFFIGAIGLLSAVVPNAIYYYNFGFSLPYYTPHVANCV